MTRFVKLGFAAALAIVTTVSASDLMAQCYNDCCGRSFRPIRGRVVARVQSRRCCQPTNNCCATTNNCCATTVAPTCCNTSVACCSTPVLGRYVGTTLLRRNNCCNTGCETSCCNGRYTSLRIGCRTNRCCNTCSTVGCGGCAGCASGQIIQGTSEGGIVVPEATGQPVEPTPVMPSDT